MSNYTITIEGHETGLTAGAIESVVRDTFPNADNISVEEQE